VTEPRYQIVTFDCYGTLIDWESGIAGAILSEAGKQGLSLDRAQVIEAHAEIEPRVQQEHYRTYREILTEVARQMAARFQFSLPAGRAGFLPESLPAWHPFPDTNSSLERLRAAGYRLGILSNIDDDLLEATCRHFTVPIALKVTAQQVRSYKPSNPHFERARNHLGSDTWLHAAQSHFHDGVPAVRLDIPVAWINRKQEPLPAGGVSPTREFTTLAAFADWLTG